jgi:two-component system nitrate/nitrite response regulator NarL
MEPRPHGPLPAQSAAEAISSIRRCWHDAKIIMLFDNVASMDLQKLLASGLDACIPMSASPCTLLKVLQLIVGEQLRVLMVGDSGSLEPSVDLQADEQEGSEWVGRPRLANVMPSFPDAARGGRESILSRREKQILKALAEGQSNKVIARACTITEAAVKAHVKSILRKIGAGNRTQAAVWAMRSGYFVDSGEMMPKDLQAARLGAPTVAEELLDVCP